MHIINCYNIQNNKSKSNPTKSVNYFIEYKIMIRVMIETDVRFVVISKNNRNMQLLLFDRIY